MIITLRKVAVMLQIKTKQLKQGFVISVKSVLFKQKTFRAKE